MNLFTPLPDATLLRGRHEFVLNACQGKRVLHLGCTDEGLTVARFIRGELMHQRLAGVAGELWGVDVDEEGIAFLREHGFERLLVLDIALEHGLASFSPAEDAMRLLHSQEFDVIVATEVLEHLPNPANFLAGVQRLMKPGHTQFIVTVPNAFRVDTLLWMLRGVELVHPDHNYWFSYATITALLRKAGFTIQEVHPYSFQSSQILPNRIHRLFRSAGGQSAGGVCATATPASMASPRFIGAYFKRLPKRMLVAMLYSRTPFWGDGLLLVTTVGDSGGASQKRLEPSL